MAAIPLCVALTADVDPDANRPYPGRTDAVSAGVAGAGVSLTACRAGLETLVWLLRELQIPCTFFWEARSLARLSAEAPHVVGPLVENPGFEHGCHGLRHEDFSGSDSGIEIGAAETLAILREASEICLKVTGVKPMGFRAPYCRWTVALGAAIKELGYAYDSTHTRTPGRGWALRPYRLADGKGAASPWELALCRARDRSGRPITGYLWALFEGQRQPQDYVALARSLAKRYAGGLLQIALHPWHLIVGQDGRALSDRTGRDAADELKAVLTGIMALEGISLVNPGAYLKGCLGGAP